MATRGRLGLGEPLLRVSVGDALDGLREQVGISDRNGTE